MTKQESKMPEPLILIRRYEEAGSVHRLATELGVCGQTVLNWLGKIGYKARDSVWKECDVGRLRAYYRDTAMGEFSLDTLAGILGRTRWGVAMKASRLGLGDYFRPKLQIPKHSQSELPWRRWVKFPHPRGMLGKKHSTKSKAIFGGKVREMWVRAKASGTLWMSPANRQLRSDRMSMRNIAFLRAGGNSYSRAKRGKRADLGEIHFRSGWEANYARYLNFQIKQGWISKWEYEPETFWFLKIKRGVRSYTPDFKVWPANGGEPYFDEVKGWMDNKSKTKLKRMKKYYPAIVINVIDQKRYAGICKTAGRIIPMWE